MALIIRPDKAFEHIEEIIQGLYGQPFEPQTQARVNLLYQSFRTEYQAARDCYQQEAVLVHFLEALENIPVALEAVGDLIEACKGRKTRGGSGEGDWGLLNRLPEKLDAGLTEAFDPSGTDPVTGIKNGQQTTLPTAADPPSSLTRYPKLEYDPVVTLNERTSLFVRLLLEHFETDGNDIRTTDEIRIPDDQTEPPKMDVVIHAPGFDVDPPGSKTKLLEITRDKDSAVRFVLIPRQLGAQTIRVEFYQEDRYIGTFERRTKVVDLAEHLPIPLVPASTAPAAPSEPQALEFASPNAAAADLELRVDYDDTHDARLLRFELTGRREDLDYYHVDMGVVQLPGTPLEQMQVIYQELSKLAGALPQTSAEIEAQAERLASLGRALWDSVFPEKFKTEYWKFRERVKTILVNSSEPWIPWEIARPYRFDDQGRREDDAMHLCERFNIARWLAGPSMAERIRVNRVQPVAPSSTNLDSVKAELAYLAKLPTKRPGIISELPSSDPSQVKSLLETAAFNVMHIAAHAGFDAVLPDNSAVQLTGGMLRPSDIQTRFGGLRPRPLVFINACHGARLQFSLTGLGGWAQTLVKAKVCAFLGAAWEVNDSLALLFAETFYDALLLEGLSVGESVQRARIKIKSAEPSNSTWLAYVLYADPVALVSGLG